MTSCALSSSFEPLYIFHGVLHSSSPRSFSNREDVSILGKLFDLFSTHTYDGEGEVAWPERLYKFIFMMYEEDEFSEEHAGLLLA